MIQELTITGIRNIHTVSLKPAEHINVLYGANGSGKTSVLEAIHMLGLARSFRTPLIRKVISEGAERCTVFGRIETIEQSMIPIGVSRNVIDDSLLIRVDGETVRTVSALARLMPIQVINADTFNILEGSPKLRRKFIDWGVFHVKHSTFFAEWQRMQKVLKQRNSLLRRGSIESAELTSWNTEVAKAAEVIDQLRYHYIQQLVPVFNEVLQALTSFEQLSIQYYRGWDKNKALFDVLQSSLQRDLQIGHTSSGPQRADLKIRLGKHNVVDILSRGQLKLVICALKLAQGVLYSQQHKRDCIFLIDDLPSELDAGNRQKLCTALEQMQCQAFITCVDKEVLAHCWQPELDVRMFHVKHGFIELDENPEKQSIRLAERLEIAHE